MWKLLKWAIILIVSVILFIIAYNVSCKLFTLDDLTIKAKYEEREEKCKMLYQISDDTIVEGVGIDIKSLYNTNVNFNIKTRMGNILYHYSIEDNLYKKTCWATITLSYDYKVLNKEYSMISMSFEEYKNGIISQNEIVIALFTILGMSMFFLMYALIVVIIRHKRERLSYNLG